MEKIIKTFLYALVAIKLCFSIAGAQSWDEVQDRADQENREILAEIDELIVLINYIGDIEYEGMIAPDDIFVSLNEQMENQDITLIYDRLEGGTPSLHISIEPYLLMSNSIGNTEGYQISFEIKERVHLQRNEFAEAYATTYNFDKRIPYVDDDWYEQQDFVDDINYRIDEAIERFYRDYIMVN